MKKQLRLMLLSSSVLTMGTAIAAGQGNYVLGFESGYGSRSAELLTQVSDGATSNAVATNKRNHADNGFIWGLLGGYQWTVYDWLYGIEANVSWQDYGDQRHSHLLQNGTHFNSVVEHHRGSVIGLTTRVGYQLAPFLMPYVRLGAETSADRLSSTLTETDGRLELQTTHRQRGVRLIAGAGMEIPLALQSLLRFEYNYSAKGRGSATKGFATNGALYYDSEYRPAQHLFKAAFVWNF
jgi:opacity protein-like surface antigen